MTSAKDVSSAIALACWGGALRRRHWASLCSLHWTHRAVHLRWQLQLRSHERQVVLPDEPAQAGWYRARRGKQGADTILAAIAYLMCLCASNCFAQDVVGTPHVGPLSSKVSGQANPKAQPSPEVLVDEGAFWTPDDSGTAYDLSGSDVDDPVSGQPIERHLP